MIHYHEIGTGKTESNTRIQAARCKFREYQRLLKNNRIHMWIRMKYLNCFVRSRLTYGCQTWNTTKYQVNRLDAYQRKSIREMTRRGHKTVAPLESQHERSKEFLPFKINSDKFLNIG